MARQAPMDGYQRRYYISTHAIDQLRERWQRGGRFRDGDDLGNLIDDACKLAVDAGKARSLEDGGPFRLVDIREEIQDDLYCILRPNRGPGKFAETVVTLLLTHMVERNFAEMAADDPRARWWEPGDRPQLNQIQGTATNAPVAKMGEKIGKALGSVVVVDPKPAPAPGPAPMLPSILVTYDVHGEDGLEQRQEEYAAADLETAVAERVIELADDAGMDNVRVWREVKMRRKVEFEK